MDQTIRTFNEETNVKEAVGSISILKSEPEHLWKPEMSVHDLLGPSRVEVPNEFTEEKGPEFPDFQRFRNLVYNFNTNPFSLNQTLYTHPNLDTGEFSKSSVSCCSPLSCTNSCSDSESIRMDVKFPRNGLNGKKKVTSVLATFPSFESTALSELEECECRNFSYDANSYFNPNQKKKHNSDLKQMEPIQCPPNKPMNPIKIKEQIEAEEKNKISIQLADNLLLSLITNVEHDSTYAIQNCGNVIQRKASEHVPEIQILVKCNDHTVQNITNPLTMTNKGNTLNPLESHEDYPQIFCVNTYNKNIELASSSNQCNPTTCVDKSSANTLGESSLRSPFSTDNNTDCYNTCAICKAKERRKCPVSEVCTSQREKEEKFRKNSALTAKKDTKQARRNSDNQQGKDKKMTSDQSRRNSKLTIRRSGSVIRNNPNIPSLGSFSLFFIVNDMNKGKCCNGRTLESSQLLSTALICVRLDGTSKTKKTSQISCPARQTCSSNKNTSTGEQLSKKHLSCSCPSFKLPPMGGLFNSFISNTPPCDCPSIKSGSMSIGTTTPNLLGFQIYSQTPLDNLFPQILCSVSVQVDENDVGACSDAVCSNRYGNVQTQSSNLPRGEAAVQVAASRKSASIQPSLTKTPIPISIQAKAPQMSTGIQASVNNYAKTPTFQPKTCTPRITPWSMSPSMSLKNTMIKEVCSSDAECKKESSKKMMTASYPNSSREFKQVSCAPSKSCMKKMQSKTSCSICKALSILTTCGSNKNVQQTNMKANELKKKAPVKKSQNFNRISHLDVTAADNFFYDLGRKEDLELKTNDYDDLKSAFEKFMIAENAKNPKCVYMKKG